MFLRPIIWANKFVELMTTVFEIFEINYFLVTPNGIILKIELMKKDVQQATP